MKATDLKPASRDLYRGTLRILLVLLHDFPDFLSEYYFSLCDVIPPRCIQLRNIILSAYPLRTTLPDPHRTLTNDPAFDVGIIPPILSDFSSILKPGDLRMSLDQYLLGRSNSPFPATLKNRLLLTTPVEDGSETYNLSLMNAMVMYIGVSSVAQAKARSGSSFFSSEDSGVVLLKFLAEDLDAEGQWIHPRDSIIYLCSDPRSTPPPQRYCPPFEIPKCAYLLVPFVDATPFCRDKNRQFPRDCDQSSFGTLHRSPSPSMGGSLHVHRAPSQPGL